MKNTFAIIVGLIWMISIVHSIDAKPRNKRFKVKSVHFTSNASFTEKRLYNVIVSRPSRFLGPVYYYPQTLEEDLRGLELFYRQNGYLESRVVRSSTTIDTLQKETHIQIEIEEGERTFIQGIGLFGNQYFTEDQLGTFILIRPGEPLRQKRIESSTLAMLKHYANHGFLEADIQPDIKINTEIHRAIVDFMIQERLQFRIGDIHLKGSGKTKPHVIFRELRFKQGEMVNYSRLLDSQRRLYLTGLFESVFIRPEPSTKADSTVKDILIELKESLSGEFNVAAGYGSVEKVRGRVEVSNQNLRGSARKIGMAVRMSFVSRGFETAFTEPWTFGLPVRTDINLLADYREEPGYDLNRTGGNVTFGRQFLKHTNVTLTFRQEFNRLKNIRVSAIPDELKADVRGIKLSAMHDTRDNLFNAKRGLYLEWSNELGRSFTGAPSQFYRSIYRIKYFYPLNTSKIFATSLEFGWMTAKQGISAIPLQERFYTGGPNSLRGFDYQKVGPLDEHRIPTGGLLKLVWHICEYRFPVYKILGGSFFVESGNVWDSPEAFDILNLRTCAGLGIRLNTFLGVVRLDYGVNLDRRNGEPWGQWAFGMGQVF